MKRFALFLIITTLLISTYTTDIFAASSGTGAPAQKKIMFYLKPDISIELNGARQVFKDANGKLVSPIVYNGTAYLPLRAVSSIMKEPIEWDSGSKTIYIGKTLAYPVKSEAKVSTKFAAAADQDDLASIRELPQGMVTGYSKPDIFVMYDFVLQTFKDTNGVTIYPLNYNGSTYLPVRSISRLMNEPITWNSTDKLISIGDGEEDADEEALDEQGEEVQEDPDEEVQEDTDEEEMDETDEETPDENEPDDEETIEPGTPNEEDQAEPDDTARVLLKDIYEREEALYYEASAKITKIKDASAEDRQTIAASTSDNYLKAQAMTLEAKSVDQTGFSDEEKEACEKLVAFADSNEYYILILENIAYLAADDQDYSMLADTFLYFAVEAQNKMRDARKLIIIE